jgi:hypothetical protein
MGTFLSLIASSFFGQEVPGFLKGKVHLVDKANLSLAQKFEAAEKEFKKLETGKAYFTGYSFLSRHEFHTDGNCRSSEPYKVKVENNEIKLRRNSTWREKAGKENEKQGKREQVGILFLEKLVENKKEIADVKVIDLDRNYEFAEEPIYWLGEAENEASLSFLDSLFDSGKYEMQKTLVFLISAHSSLRAYDFLKKVALGDYSKGIKENAIFWLGNYKDEKALACLRQIYKKEKDLGLTEHLVFALQLSDQREAIEELINIAKNDSDQDVRKKAIFWLGQKASKECAKALQDIVGESGDIAVKESAIFAISQLPKDKSVPMLIDIARTNKNLSIRKKAIFWLGQTDSAEALKFFEEILLKK